MANKVFAIQDLVEEIYDFSDAGRDAHREKLSAVQDEFRVWFYDAADELETSYYISEYPRYRGGTQDNPFLSYVLECCTLEHQLNYAKCFKRCRCCSRHSHYKTEAKPLNPLPESKKMEKCHCKCRHYSRIFQSRVFV